MKFKKSICMLIVPAFVLATTVGCSSDESVASKSDAVAMSADGSYVQVAESLNKAYEEAKASGYTGTYEEFVKLIELQQTNPAAAQQQAASQGFSGFEMLMAGAMGMMLGNMMSNGAYNSYRDRQRSYGSSAYARPTASNLNTAKNNFASQKAAAAKSASASRSTSSVSRGGFGGATSSGG